MCSLCPSVGKDVGGGRQPLVAASFSQDAFVRCDGAFASVLAVSLLSLANDRSTTFINFAAALVSRKRYRELASSAQTSA